MYLITWLFQAIHKKLIFRKLEVGSRKSEDLSGFRNLGFTSRWRRVVGLLYKQTKKQRERLRKPQRHAREKPQSTHRLIGRL